MAGDVIVRRLNDGAIIFSEDDPADGMYVVLGGKVRIFRSTNGHETTLAILAQGDIFGEMALFDHQPRSATAEAVGEVELRCIGKDQFDAMIPDPYVRRMLTKMSERLRHVDDIITRLDAENDARHAYVESLSMRREWTV